MKRNILILVSCLLVFSCSMKTNQPENSMEATTGQDGTTKVPDMHKAENELDNEGVYQGKIPAADCPGIQVVITLNKDKSFARKNTYLERNKEYTDTGTYIVRENTLYMITEKNDTSCYRVEEDNLRMLDRNKQEITGSLADKYILKKKK